MLYSCHVRQKATCVCFVRRGEDGIKGGNPKSGATALISKFSESEWGELLLLESVNCVIIRHVVVSAPLL